MVWGASRSASADQAGPRNTVSLHPLSFAAHGVALQYERYVAPRRFSLVLGAGLRSSSRQDYESWVTTVGIEPRWWLAQGDRRSRLGRDAMVGPYLSLRSDVSFLSMSDTTREKWVGGNIGLSVVGAFGWRFTIGRVELTPSLGLGWRSDFDVTERLAPWSRPLLRFDWTAGWMF
jgi:hypothetical protein